MALFAPSITGSHISCVTPSMVTFVLTMYPVSWSNTYGSPFSRFTTSYCASGNAFLTSAHAKGQLRYVSSVLPVFFFSVWPLTFTAYSLSNALISFLSFARVPPARIYNNFPHWSAIASAMPGNVLLLLLLAPPFLLTPAFSQFPLLRLVPQETNGL